MARISRTYLPIKAAISFFMDAFDQAPIILLKMQDQISLTLCWHSVDALLTLCWRSFSGCGWPREYPYFAHQGGLYAKNEPWLTNVNTLRLTVAYLNATINVKPKTQNRRLNPTGLVKPGETCWLTGTSQDLAHQQSAGQDFGRVWKRTDPFLRSKPGLLAGYPNPLLTLHHENHQSLNEAHRSLLSQ